MKKNNYNNKINNIVNYSLKHFFKETGKKQETKIEIRRLIDFIKAYHIKQIDEYISMNNIDISEMLYLDNMMLLDIFDFNKLYLLLSYQIDSDHLKKYDNNICYYHMINKAVLYKMLDDNIDIKYISLFAKTFYIEEFMNYPIDNLDNKIYRLERGIA